MFHFRLNTSPSCFLFPHSDKFAEVLQKQQQDRIERNRERIHMMNANPFDPDVQTKIAEEIRWLTSSGGQWYDNNNNIYFCTRSLSRRENLFKGV